MEWLKVPALSFSVGAFRHGPLEIVQPGLGAVVFAEPGPAHAHARRLAQQLEGYGAAVLVVEGGETLAPAEPGPAGAALDGLLAQMLAVVPVQIFVEALADQRGAALGFRHIDKVMTSL
jgi:glutamine---fructose-6-phosphate transaminase (isomerizing)